jgi:hypothetical protein
MPGYDVNHGKLSDTVTLRVHANSWSLYPGAVVALRNMGPITGRFIVETFEFDLLNLTEATVTLTKPLPARKEPAPETITVDVGPDTVSGSAQKTLAWARSRIGHYAEDFGSNRGQELDALEKQFGMSGAPWCAIFATTALVQGGITRDCRTAAVADINQWAQAGSHGFTKGFRGTPRPGDLMTFGNDHVAIVEKVNSDGTVGTIEGNTSAGKVARLKRDVSSGKFVRPDYVT